MNSYYFKVFFIWICVSYSSYVDYYDLINSRDDYNDMDGYYKKIYGYNDLSEQEALPPDNYTSPPDIVSSQPGDDNNESHLSALKRTHDYTYDEDADSDINPNKIRRIQNNITIIDDINRTPYNRSDINGEGRECTHCHKIKAEMQFKKGSDILETCKKCRNEEKKKRDKKRERELSNISNRI